MSARIRRCPIMAGLLTIVILINSSYAYSTVDDSWAIVLLGISVPLLLLSSNKSGYRVNRGQFIALFLVVGFFISMLVNRETAQLGAYARQIFVILFAIIFVKKVNFVNFYQFYLHALDWLCIISLIYLFLYNAIGGLAIASYTNGNNVTFDSIGLAVIQRNNPWRLCGPFWEPGIFASFIVIGMIYETYATKESKRVARTLLYLVSLAMTQSTAGYFLGALALVMRFVSTNSQKMGFAKKVLVYAGILICFIFSTLLIEAAAYVLPGVFKKLTFGNYSMSTRISNPLIDLLLWKRAPFFGLGIRRYNMLWGGVAANYFVNSRTSTATYFLATIGVFGLAYLVLLFRGGFHQNRISRTERIILICVLLAIVTKEPHNLNVLMFIVILFFNSARLREAS